MKLVAVIALAALLSAVASVFGLRNLTAMVAECGMGLGCNETPPAAWLGLLGVVTPFVLFSCAAVVWRRVLPVARAWPIAIVCVLSPVVILLCAPMFDDVVADFSTARRAASIDYLRNAPVTVEILQAKLIDDDGKKGALQLDVKAAGLPGKVSAYEYLFDFYDGRYFAEPNCVIAERLDDDSWRFFVKEINIRGVQVGEGNTFSLALEFRRQTMAAQAPPTKLRVLLTVAEPYDTYPGGNFHYPQDVTFFERTFPLRLSQRRPLQ